MTVPADREAMAARDAADPLAFARARFALPEGVIYLDGNSLGALPRSAAARAADVVGREWGEGLIRSWNDADWIGLPRRVAAKLARLIGAEADEVLVADSTSINLFKLLAAALRLRPGRPVILSERGNFPTDLYVADGLARWLGAPHELRAVPRAEIAATLDERVAVLMLTEVDYRSGERHDMAALTRAAHEAGALALWDLSHSAGAMPVDLGAAGADLAIGCGYKYLNGGPGAPAFLYVARRWHEAIEPAIAGWMGHARPFAFEPAYAPADGIGRLLTGTPSVIAFSVLDAALDAFDGVDMAALRAKSVALTDAFIALIERRCAGHGLALASPREAAKRGSQVSFRHESGYPIMQALIARGVIGDFRAPDIMRFGFAPLYLRHVDVWDAVDTLAAVLDSGAWRDPRFGRVASVT
ncbi:MAG: kynureninase [Alphaproteobacteria bacterium]